MEPKKTNKANLEKQRTLYFEIGLLVALGVVLAAFEWGTNVKSNIEITTNTSGKFETEQAPVVPPEPVQNKPPQFIADQLLISETEIPSPFEPTFLEPGDLIPNLTEFTALKPPIEEPEEVLNEFEADIQAEFMKGNTSKFIKWVGERIKYPEIARINGIEGKVIASFVIDKKGNLTDIKILREIDKSLAEETIRVLNLSPQWKPAIRKGKVISVQYQIPIDYRLSSF